MNDLITHELNNIPILQRAEDGYFNATAMCKASGKLIADYRQNKTTNEFLNALSGDMGIPITELIQVVRGGRQRQGTWVHPKVSIHLSQWLSPTTAVQVTNWVHDWIVNGSQPEKQLPVPLKDPKPITTIITTVPGQPPKYATHEGPVIIVPAEAYKKFHDDSVADYLGLINRVAKLGKKCIAASDPKTAEMVARM